MVDKAKALAAVPEAVGKTITSFSNISENLFCKFFDTSSLPYGVLSSLLALRTAFKTSGHAPVTLSDANCTLSRFVFILCTIIVLKNNLSNYKKLFLAHILI